MTIPSLQAEEVTPSGYTINYETVSAAEYVRFVSKICNTNFIFQEEELKFDVSIISDAPITKENVMATLIQVLRMHDFSLLEQDGSLLIHKADGVNQVAKLVTKQGEEQGAALVTRIFRIKNAKVDSIAGIIRSMISKSALLELSQETRQLILTDITPNVDKIASLIEILDSPHAPLEIAQFEAKENAPEYLVELCNQIMLPMAQGQPFILVPQPLANEIFVVSTENLVTKASQVLKTLDTPPKRQVLSSQKLQGDTVFVYKAEHKSNDEILKSLLTITKNLQSSGLPERTLIGTIESARLVQESNSILFVGTKDTITKVKEFLAALDAPNEDGKAFFVYRPHTKSAKDIQEALQEMASNLEAKEGNEALITSIQNAKVNNTTNTLIFSGEKTTFSHIRELLATIDEVGKGGTVGENSYYIYKVAHSTHQELQKSLNHFAKDLDKSNVSDEGIIRSIHQMKYIEETNSLLFTGPSSALKRLKEIVPSFDSDINSIPHSNQFFVYKPKHLTGEELSLSLKEVTENLKTDRFSDQALLRSLQSMKYVRSTNSLLFTGDDHSIQRLEALIGTIDTEEALLGGTKNFFLFHPKHATRGETEKYLKDIADHLSKKEQHGLIQSIHSMKWIEPSHSFLFHGSNAALTKLKELLKNFDTEEMQKPGYAIYTVEHTTGDILEDDLDELAKTMRSSGTGDAKLLEAIENVRYVKETNSLTLTGDPASVAQLKTLLKEYDTLRGEKQPGNTSFLLYKPKYTTATQIQKSLFEIASNLKKADHADPHLLKAINTSKYVTSTNSLIFTAPDATLKKLDALLKEVDTSSYGQGPIQQMGETNFFLYKLKSSSQNDLIASIKAMLSDFKKSKEADPAVVAALSSMRYVKDSHSLLFTGKEEALEKVHKLVEQLDNAKVSYTKGHLPVHNQPNFYLYKPQSVPGPELEKLMHDFAENLRMSGLSDQDLFNSINSMRYVEKTQSLIFTGTTKALDQVKELLVSFDLPTNAEGGGTGHSLQPFDKTNFLVYKLQFHKGDEIQTALKQIARDLAETAPVQEKGAPHNNLFQAINTIQWLQLTNSLICSGDQETLTRLKELIKNLDVPLKQVFIEMLVVETTLTNALNFGLEWGTNYKYKDKFAGSSYNTSTGAKSSNTGTAADASDFMGYLSRLAPSSSTPTPVKSGTGTSSVGIGPTSGFDLGVIGQVIKHNGSSFLTIGSLLSALQNDIETSIVMTPKIIAQDGHMSSIFVGRNVPFTSSFINNSGASTIATTNLEYRDVGTNLTITPVLGNSDMVTLDIQLDRTSQVGDAAGNALSSSSGSQVSGITTTKTNMTTTVHVPNENFLILSGFVDNSSVKAKAGIPCLGGLPLLGAAFSKSDDTITNSNIVIFLRPHIISSKEHMERITSDQEDFFRDQAGSPFLENRYDEATEMIKSMDDE